jgi:hypothetical protein
MIININPNRINTTPSAIRKEAERRANSSRSEIPTPKRAHVNIIPSPDSLSTMIRSAVAAFRQGKSWDRGTILNLLV